MSMFSFHSHDHEPDGEAYDFWAEFFGLLTDPAHLAFELTFSLIFDILVVSVIWGIVIKKFIIPKLRRDIHKEIDEEHGYESHESKDQQDS